MRTQEIANANLAVIASLSRLSSGGRRDVVQQSGLHQVAEDEALFTTPQAGSGENYAVQHPEQAVRYTADAASTIISSPSAAYSAQAANITRSLQVNA